MFQCFVLFSCWCYCCIYIINCALESDQLTDWANSTGNEQACLIISMLKLNSKITWFYKVPCAYQTTYSPTASSCSIHWLGPHRNFSAQLLCEVHTARVMLSSFIDVISVRLGQLDNIAKFYDERFAQEMLILIVSKLMILVIYNQNSVKECRGLRCEARLNFVFLCWNSNF